MDRLFCAYGVISKGNGETILSKERHMALSCGGGQAGQGYPAVCYEVQMDGVKCLNPWDVQCKHIVTPDGISESLCAGEKRWGSLPPNVCYEVQMDDGVIGVDLYNQSVTGAVSKALNSAATDSDHIPVVIVLNDQGGSVMDVSNEVTATLRAQDHGHPPIICMNQWENRTRRIYGIDGVFPTLCTGEHSGQNQQAICYEKDEKQRCSR